MSIPILMYHHILQNDSFIASSIENFDKQMAFLRLNDFRTISSETLLLYKQKKMKLPKKSVMITFDDGWRDNFVYAYPILKKYNLRATLFVATEWIEMASAKEAPFMPLKHNQAKKEIITNPRAVVCNWEELEQMRDVFDIHSHTHSHRDFYFNKQYRWREEFELSKKLLKQRLGIHTTQLCWPRGKFDSELLSLAKESGYDTFYTTKRGVNTPNYKRDALKRFAVKKDEKWLKKSITLFSNPWLGYLYAKIKAE